MTIKTTTATLQPTVTYAAAYATLASIADRLKGVGTAASIDTLAQDVSDARRAYEAARSRLEKIRAEIDAELASDTVSART